MTSKNPTTETAPLAEQMAEAVGSALESGIVEKLVAERLEKSVSDAIDDTLRWGRVRDAVKSKIENALVPAIERVSLGDFDAKLEPVLLDIARQSTFEDRRRMLENFAGLVSDAPESGVITARSLFDAFCKQVASDWDCCGREVEFDDGPHYLPLNCVMEIATEPARGYASAIERATLALSIVGEDDLDAVANFEREVMLWRFTSIPMRPANSRKRDEVCEDGWMVESKHPATFGGLARMNAVDILLARMTSGSIPLETGGVWSYDDSVYPDTEPEADWS